MMEGGKGSPQKWAPLVGLAGRAILPWLVRTGSRALMGQATKKIAKNDTKNAIMKLPKGGWAAASRFVDKAGGFLINPVKALGFSNPILRGVGSVASWLTVPGLIEKGYNYMTGTGKDEELYDPNLVDTDTETKSKSKSKSKGGGSSSSSSSGGGGTVVIPGGNVPTNSKELQAWIKSQMPKPKREHKKTVVPGVSETTMDLHRRGSLAGTKKMETKKNLITGAVTTTKTKGKSSAGLEGKKIKSTTVLPGGVTIKKKEKYGRKVTGEGDAGDWWSGRRKKSKTTVRAGDLVIKTKRKKGGKVIVKTRKKGGLFSKRTRIS